MEHWLERAAKTWPERLSVGDVPYRELAARARVAEAALVERGVTPGERVALALSPGPEFVAALHGCWLAGAVAVPIDRRWGASERAARVAGATLVDAALDAAPTKRPTELDLDAIATVMHTSGTTGIGRPVELTYRNWLSSALGSALALGLDQAERWLCPLPLAHVGGLSIPIRSAIYGTTAVLHERFDTERVLSVLMDECAGVTLVSLVPTMLARLLDAGLRSPPRLRWVLLGGGPITPDLLSRAGEAGVPVAPSYGMTEACSQIATHGRPLIGSSVQVGADGELLVRGPTVAPGSIGADGWLHTGDLGEIDQRGQIRIIGRKAETIITGGENVAPAEVEAVLLSHPAVADVGVFGRVDPDWGEAVVAAVVLRDGLEVSAGELREFCRGRLTAFKVPKVVELTANLPRTDSGKLLRRELR